MPRTVQGRCCSLDDVYDARGVAETLGIPYYVVNQEERFEHEVVRPFVAEYLSGRTPIPCSLCNNHLKFDQLLITARQIGAETAGHRTLCAQRVRRAKRPLAAEASRRSCQGPDLFPLRTDAGAVEPHDFPAGRYAQAGGARRGQALGLALVEKPDSQEICFVPGGDYKRFLDAYLAEQGEALPDTSGELVTSSGEVIGEHRAFTTSPSASARDWVSRRDRPST